jgi:hypothetical protein
MDTYRVKRNSRTSSPQCDSLLKRQKKTKILYNVCPATCNFLTIHVTIKSRYSKHRGLNSCLSMHRVFVCSTNILSQLTLTVYCVPSVYVTTRSRRNTQHYWHVLCYLTSRKLRVSRHIFYNIFDWLFNTESHNGELVREFRFTLYTQLVA